MESSSAKREEIRHHLFAAADRPRELVYTALVYLECMVVPVREGNTQLVAAYDVLLSHPECRQYPITDALFGRALGLCSHYRLKTVDAIHIAAAEAAGCDEGDDNGVCCASE